MLLRPRYLSPTPHAHRALRCAASRCCCGAVEGLVHDLVAHGRSLGVNIPAGAAERPPIVMAGEEFRGPPPITAALNLAASRAEAASGRKLQLVLVIKQDQNAEQYGVLRMLCLRAHSLNRR